jgi:ribonuclease P protein component
MFQSGRRLNGTHLQLLASPAQGPAGRVGFVIGKKQLARAVDRNYVRRLMREAVRSRRPGVDAFDIVLRLREPCAPLPLATLLPEAAALLDALAEAHHR